MQKTLTIQEGHGNSERERERKERACKRTNLGQQSLDVPKERPPKTHIKQQYNNDKNKHNNNNSNDNDDNRYD